MAWMALAIRIVSGPVPGKRGNRTSAFPGPTNEVLGPEPDFEGAWLSGRKSDWPKLRAGPVKFKSDRKQF